MYKDAWDGHFTKLIGLKVVRAGIHIGAYRTYNMEFLQIHGYIKASYIIHKGKDFVGFSDGIEFS